MTDVWPLWDLSLGLLVFIDGQPRLMSSTVMDVFRAQHRRDVRNVPELSETNWDYYAINDNTLPRAATSGRYTVVFLGEREEPYPFRPMGGQSMNLLPQDGEPNDLFLAGFEAIKPAYSSLVLIHSDGSVLSSSGKIPKSLGYTADDTSWIPAEWREPLELRPAEIGSSPVDDNADLEFRWIRMRANLFNAYAVRVRASETS